jgi:hypothetical protein
MMPMSAWRPGRRFVEAVLDDEAPRRRQALLELELLVAEGGWRMREALVVEARRALHQRLARNRRRDVVAALEAAAHMAGADAQLQDGRRVAGLGQREAVLDHAHHGRQLRARIEQQQRGLHGEGVGALLDHAGALAVILADDDQRAARHAGRGEVGQRIGGDVGADHRLPGHRAAQG